jgi:serine O-acetyltransferase
MKSLKFALGLRSNPISRRGPASFRGLQVATTLVPNQYQTFIEFLKLVREDLSVHQGDWTQPGFRAVAVYRFGVWVKMVQPRFLREPLACFYRSMFRYVRNHYGIELHDTAIVGRRLLIAHQGGIVIHYKAVIGDDCLIRHNVTIGAASDERYWEGPKLGHRVQVGSGAAILGKITIGDGARIGPNAVVMTNVPAGATAFAAPARIIESPARPKVSKEE